MDGKEMEALETNTVHVAVPAGADIGATRAVFERFGEVASVHEIKGVEGADSSKVSVTFFDVRAAKRATTALGSTYKYCVPGPQAGSRTVKLMGPVPVDTAFLPGISGIYYQGVWDGQYAVEFYDLRDAARFRREMQGSIVAGARTQQPAAAAIPLRVQPPAGMLEGERLGCWDASGGGLDDRGAAPDPLADGPDFPPGLPPPPGLSPGRAQPDPAHSPQRRSTCAAGLAPTGLDGDGFGFGAVCQVLLSGLPSGLLEHAMMEAILEQTGVDGAVLGFSTQACGPCGEALISFSSYPAAARLTTHIQGCRWAQGAQVCARMVFPSAARPAPRAGAPQATPLAAGGARASLRKGAPAFIHLASPPSAEGPLFGPGAEDREFEKDPGFATAASEVSTELGESEAENERETPIPTAWLGARRPHAV